MPSAATIDPKIFSDADPADSPHFRWQLINRQAIDALGTFPENHFDCIWTDPPYLLSNGGITCHAGKMVSVDKGDWDKSNGWETDLEFTEEWMTECHRVLKPTGTIWVSGTLHFHPIAGMALIKSGFRLLNDIIWEKPNPPPNLGCRTFTHSTELIYWAAKAKKGKRPNYRFNYADMKAENGDKQMKTVWQYTAPGRNEKTFGKHPTQKPVALIERCIRASTAPDDLILDPFAGVASTGVAALKSGRRFIGIEVEKQFIHIATQRLKACTPPPPPPILQGQSTQPMLLLKVLFLWMLAWVRPTSASSADGLDHPSLRIVARSDLWIATLPSNDCKIWSVAT